MKRWLACVLGLAMLLSLAGCGSKESGGDNSATPAKDYVYVPEYKTLEDNVSPYNGIVVGEKMYYQNSNWDEETQTLSNSINIMDLNTLEIKEIPLSIPDTMNIARMTVQKDESFVMLLNSWNESSNTQTWHLAIMDASGNEILNRDITNILSQGGGDSQYTYPDSVKVDSDGNIFVLISAENQRAVVLNTQGEKLFDISVNSWSQGLCQDGEGRVFIICHADQGNGYMLQQIDPKTKALGDSYTGIPGGNGSMEMSLGSDGSVLISSGSILYRYDFDSQTCEEILNWIDCDINSDQINTVASLSDGRLVTFSQEYDADFNQKTEAVYLTKTPASEVKQKTVLTYATFYLDYQLRAQIIRFNKTNETYRIEVKEYGAGGDYETAQTQLNSDIVSGNPPDLIDLNNGGDISSYISKGILADLTSYIDGSVGREGLISSALNICAQDGKIYGMPLSFSIQSLLGRTSDVGPDMGWTVSDVKDLLASKPAGTLLFDYAYREYLLPSFLTMDIDSYIDLSTGTCSFDSDSFVELLEFINTFPSAEQAGMGNDEGIYSKISSGKILLLSITMSNVTDYLAHASMFGAPVTAIGFPSASGNGTLIDASMMLGISEKSQNKDGAWEFIEGLLSEEFQDSLDWNFPIRKSSLDKQLEEAKTMEEGSATWGWDDFTYESKPATEEEIATVCAIIDSARPRPSHNEEILSIVAEDAAPFFAGQKSAREVADIIQSRVQLYVSENY
ncbi:MAG: extracellular solute-binding protein [Lachnospiraceae bacterium]|jgi:ABC-type glycerol-3-phosphate transport system substrate-binding protein|nr:extracellular solute-binding protein [Lachnospiraceae bacterium]